MQGSGIKQRTKRIDFKIRGIGRPGGEPPSRGKVRFPGSATERPDSDKTKSDRKGGRIGSGGIVPEATPRRGRTPRRKVPQGRHPADSEKPRPGIRGRGRDRPAAQKPRSGKRPADRKSCQSAIAGAGIQRSPCSRHDPPGRSSPQRLRAANRKPEKDVPRAGWLPVGNSDRKMVDFP